MSANQIDFLPETLVVTGGPAFSGDPGCGAVLDVDDYLIKIKQQDSNNPEEMIPITKDLHRLNQLGDMVRLAMDGNHNDAEFSEKMKKYELQYGSVPDEFSELLGEIEDEN